MDKIYRYNLDVIDLTKSSKEIMKHGVGDSGNMKAALEVEEQPNIDRTFDQGCRHKWWRKAVCCRWTLSCFIKKGQAYSLHSGAGNDVTNWPNQIAYNAIHLLLRVPDSILLKWIHKRT